MKKVIEIRKSLGYQIERLQIELGAAELLFSKLGEIPYKTRRDLGARLRRMNSGAVSLRKQISGY